MQTKNHYGSILTNINGCVMIDIADLDVVFLSYKEPNKEHNWLDLKAKCPWAKRVDGVEGSDAAHKAAGECAKTERFVLVDGDNIVDPAIFDQQIDLSKQNENVVIRWRSLNNINGLKYGNGGVSCWTKQFVRNMKTHENTDGSEASLVEFCYEDGYLAYPQCYSTTIINHTAQQAWQAGFREGVKMSLDRGKRKTPGEFLQSVHKQNLLCLLTWMSVGADVKHGLWAMYGACEGCYMTMVADWDHVNVRDFKYLEQHWDDKHIKEQDLANTIDQLIAELNYTLGVSASRLGAEQSKFFKFCMKW